MSKNKCLEQTVSLLPIPRSGRLKPECAQYWLENDFVYLQRVVSDTVSGETDPKALAALSYFAMELGYAVAGCAESVRTQVPIRFSEEFEVGSSDWLDWTKDLALILEALWTPNQGDSVIEGYRLIAGEMRRRITALASISAASNVSSVGP